MTAEDQVIERLVSGQGATDIARGIGVSRTQVYNILDGLADSGVISRRGDLPNGAVTELCPPAEFTPLIEYVFSSTDWSDRVTDSIRSSCVRYGIVAPKPDARDSYVDWRGHTARRVDFNIGAARVMVVGSLVPRMDKLTWQRATPKWRNVYLEYEDGDNASMPWERERLVTSLDIVGKLWFTTNKAPKSLLLAVAWVCESFALLGERIGQ